MVEEVSVMLLVVMFFLYYYYSFLYNIFAHWYVLCLLLVILSFMY